MRKTDFPGQGDVCHAATDLDRWVWIGVLFVTVFIAGFHASQVLEETEKAVLLPAVSLALIATTPDVIGAGQPRRVSCIWDKVGSVKVTAVNIRDWISS